MIFPHLIAVISILGSIAKADGLDGPGTVLPKLAWTEFTFYSAKNASEAFGTMSPEARGNTPFGAVKCVNAEKDDWIGNIEVKTAGDRGVEDYYCLVQWDDPDCSGTGGYVWMNNHMPTEGDWTRSFQFDTERKSKSASVGAGKCSAEVQGTV